MSDLPHQKILLVDGECGLCAAMMRFVARRDRHHVFRFATLQSNAGQELCREAGLDPANIRSVLLFTGTRVLQRSDAAIDVLRSLGGGWALLAPFRWVPRFLRDKLYTFVATNRYRWFGRTTGANQPCHSVSCRLLRDGF